MKHCWIEVTILANPPFGGKELKNLAVFETIRTGDDGIGASTVGLAPLNTDRCEPETRRRNEYEGADRARQTATGDSSPPGSLALSAPFFV